MSHIRINELARELEVPNKHILDLLPGLGITDKKTHSSSIEEDVALRIRRMVSGDSDYQAPPPSPFEEGSPEESMELELETPEVETPAVPVEAAEPEPSPVAAEPQAAPSQPTPPAVERKVQPLRPPVGSGPAPGQREPVPARPSPSAPAPPRAFTPPRAPTTPQGPSPRPGQILSGPRQPLPPNIGEAPRPPLPQGPPVAQAPRPPMPGSVAPPPQPPGIPRPPAPRPPQTTAPGAPQPPRPAAPPQRPAVQPPQYGRQLVGQPAARPVVPPRPDLVVKLAQTQQRPAPQQPQQVTPRPGMPTRPQSPLPGQPMAWRGPLRPGQPIVKPGTAPVGPRGARPRGMHPTSVGIVPPPPQQPVEQRRDAGKRPRPVARTKREEYEGKMLRMPSRREEEVIPINREITISEGITVKELSEKLGTKANLVIKKLVERKIFATINQSLDVKLADELAREFGASTNQVSYEQEATKDVAQAEEPKDLSRRAPVVTIMGHVDHGKTSLLDAIRSANVAAKEAGGITQHIGAYYVEKNGRKIVFIDTPGHEAFTRMRARGAKVTDIVVLVVAADDGVMPQTLEAIDHAKAAKVPIIVAVNKIDKGDAQPERIKQQLADRGLLAEDWGGETVMVPVSAKTGQNLDLLLEMILLVADLGDFKANPNRPAVGSVLEAQLDRGRGPVATVLVRNGTLRVGDFFICGSVFGKVRAMFDDRGNAVKDAEPSTPVEVLGLESLPDVGDTFQVVTDTVKAKQIVMYREGKAREQAMQKSPRLTLDQLHQQLKEGEIKDLNLIIKADVGGSAEVLADTLQKLSTDKIRIRVLRAGVGAINESDVLLASTSESTIIIGFNVRPERNATALADQEGVEMRLHTIIYELVDEIKRAMTGMLEPVFKEVYKGRASVRDIFHISKVGTIAGCMVVDGSIPRDGDVRVLRDNVVVHTGKIGSLKRFKNDASEVKSGFECGISLANFNDIKPGDVIEAFATERVAVEALV